MRDLALQLAEKHTQTFADNVVRQHEMAMHCLDCEEILAHGIKAYDWIKTAERVLREADEADLIDLDNELEEALCTLWEAWLAPVPGAEAMIATTERNGFTPENLKAFQDAKVDAAGIVESNSVINLGRKHFFESLSNEE